MNTSSKLLFRPVHSRAGGFRLAVAIVALLAANAGWSASPGSPAEAVAALRNAIAQGDGPTVEQLVTSYAPLLGTALNEPENASAIATALRALNTSNPPAAASAARIAGAIATLAESLPLGPNSRAAQSASTLTAAVGTVIARPAVIAAAPAAAANAARTASGVASNPGVINANPIVAAQIARDTIAVARNPIVMQVAPVVAGAIAANVAIIAANAAVRAAAPTLASRAAAEAIAVIHHENVSSSNQAAARSVETNLGVTPSIDPTMNVSRSGE